MDLLEVQSFYMARVDRHLEGPSSLKEVRPGDWPSELVQVEEGELDHLGSRGVLRRVK